MPYKLPLRRLMLAAGILIVAGCAQQPENPQLSYRYGELWGGDYEPGYHGEPRGALQPWPGLTTGLTYGTGSGSLHDSLIAGPWRYPWYHSAYHHGHTYSGHRYPWYHSPYSHWHAFASPHSPRYPLTPVSPWVRDPSVAPPATARPRAFVIPSARGTPSTDRIWADRRRLPTTRTTTVRPSVAPPRVSPPRPPVRTAPPRSVPRSPPARVRPRPDR